MIQLSPNRALIRLFLFFLDILATFTGGKISRDSVATGTDTCTVGKTFIVGFLVALLQVSVFALGIWFALIHPFKVWGWTIVYGTLSLAAVIGALVLCFWLFGLFANRSTRSPQEQMEYTRRMSEEAARENADSFPRRSKEPSSFQLFKEWRRAVRDRLCLMVSWTAPLPQKRSRLAEFAMSKKKLVLASLAMAGITLVLHLLPLTFVHASANILVTKESWCSVNSAWSRGEHVISNLSCGGSSAWSKQNKVAAYFLNQQIGGDRKAVIVCKIYGDDEADCTVP